MEYVVDISSRAEIDLAGIYSEIDAENSDAALRWYLGPRDAILGLDQHPNRCPYIKNSRVLRCILYGHKPHFYRVLYSVLEEQKRVVVAHIRHGARRGDL